MPPFKNAGNATRDTKFVSVFHGDIGPRFQTANLRHLVLAEASQDSQLSLRDRTAILTRAQVAHDWTDFVQFG